MIGLRRVCLLGVVSVFVFSLTACSDKLPALSSLETALATYGSEEAGEPLTIDYICENSDLEPEDFEGIDFDAFVSYFKLTTKNFEGTNIRFLLSQFDNIVGDFSRYKVTTEQFKPEYMDQISYIIISGTDPAGSEQLSDTTVIDFVSGHVYSPASLSFVTYDMIVRDIDDQLEEQMIGALEDCDICSWRPAFYEDDVFAIPEGQMDGGETARVMMIVMEEGTVFQMSYIWSDDSTEARQFYDCVARLRTLAGVA